MTTIKQCKECGDLVEPCIEITDKYVKTFDKCVGCSNITNIEIEEINDENST